MNAKAKSALLEYRAKLASGEIQKPQRLNPYERALSKPKSMAYAIKAYCWQCVGADGTPNWQDEVRYCPVTKCALHHVRPYNEKHKEIEDN